MPSFHLRRPSPALVISALALALGMTAGATAATLITGKQVKNSSLTGVDVRNRSLTGADVKDKSLTPRDFDGSVVGATGPPGPAGPAGPAGVAGATGADGADGADATNLWAVVDTGASGASIVRGSGTVSAARLGMGTYTVTFNQNVTGCSYLANQGSPSDVAGEPGETSVEGRGFATDPNVVEVRTEDSAGVTIDADGFHLAVFC